MCVAVTTARFRAPVFWLSAGERHALEHPVRQGWDQPKSDRLLVLFQSDNDG